MEQIKAIIRIVRRNTAIKNISLCNRYFSGKPICIRITGVRI